MSTQKESISQELDSKFVVSDYLSSNPPVPVPILIAFEAMSIPQRFQVEQSMNEIVAKWSEKEQKAYLERCKALESGWTQTVTFSERKEGKTVKRWTFNHVNVAARALLEWVQRFPLARITPKMLSAEDALLEELHSFRGIIFCLTSKHPHFAERIRLDPNQTGNQLYLGTINSSWGYERVLDMIGKAPTEEYTLTQEETDLVLGERLNTSKFTMKDCLEFISNENRVWVEDHWLYINVSNVSTRIE